MAEQRILLAGIGNIFLGDDGFGSEVAQRLARLELPPEVKLVDYGLRGFDLAYAILDEWPVVVLIDALPRGEAPGTLTLLEADLGNTGDDSIVHESGGFSGHLMTPAAVFSLVRMLGGKPKRVLIMGCEPESFGPENEGRMGLSEVVAAAVPGAVEMVLDLVDRLIVETATDPSPTVAGDAAPLEVRSTETEAPPSRRETISGGKLR